MKLPPFVASVIWFLVILTSFPILAEELIGDPHFKHGFIVRSPKRGEPAQGTIGVSEGVEPVWFLAQWHSKYSIVSTKPERISDQAVKYGNESKMVVIGPSGSDGGNLTLAVDTRPEYGEACRVPICNWPHLLVAQPIRRSASIDQIESLRLHIEARLLYDERFQWKNYHPKMHTAQVPYVLIIQNVNRKSQGYGDFFWFSVPIYDTRHPEAMPPHIARDTADPSAKLIYNPGSEAFGDYRLHDRKWHAIDVDLMPIIHDAFKTAWKKGYLQGSKDLSDYKITSMNLGWEVTGVNRAAIEFRNLSLDMEN